MFSFFCLKYYVYNILYFVYYIMRYLFIINIFIILLYFVYNLYIIFNLLRESTDTIHVLKKWNCNTVHLLKKGHIYFARVIWNFPVVYSRILLPSSFIVRIEMNALNVPLKVWAEMEITPGWIRTSIAWKRRWLIATCVIECYRTVTLSCYWFCWFLNSTHTFLRRTE